MKNRFSDLPFEVDLFGQLANLKEVDYKNTLMITAIVEVLVEKGLITRKEVLKKAEELDQEIHFDPEHDSHFI
ncbi:hypothetical protein LSG31_05530 [Fodinisporobacter ferrooxydans]|uniref:Uncharacterized protein n=1 Tax=Fodinisporobacter ferrooxydans TaxID=2901836 RepID=A0ABY4CN45_9BACL|nr:hypothetical protein LSG31_05530 [Alicyclobacillaceae bacterium MYW30-H2]